MCSFSLEHTFCERMLDCDLIRSNTVSKLVICYVCGAVYCMGKCYCMSMCVCGSVVLVATHTYTDC